MKLGSIAFLISLASVLSSPEIARARLGVGDEAPKLGITKWIQGEGLELEKVREKKVVVLEFWATWCGPCVASIPHLTALQEKYGDKIAIVGVTKPDGRGNTLERVENFVKDRKDVMKYAVAWDGNNQTYNAYMRASGQRGIPTSFVIDQKGKVAWIGHPMSLDRMLSRLIGADGDDSGVDRDLVSILSLLNRRLARLKSSEARESLEGALRVMHAMQALAPEDKTLLPGRFHLELKLESWEAAAETARTVVDSSGDNPGALNNVAWALLTTEGLKGKYNELALKAAVRCNEVTKARSYAFLDTLALAKFESGAREEAVELQKQVIALAKKYQARETLIAEFEGRLKRYEAGSDPAN